jgi:hypothetical protein
LQRSVEVFNLADFLKQTGKTNATNIEATVDEAQKIVIETLSDLNQDDLPEERPSFRFHPGANLLVVIGPPETLEVVRKVLTALPGVNTAAATPAPAAPTASRLHAEQQAREAFMRRYGLTPPAAPPSEGSGVANPSP